MGVLENAACRGFLAHSTLVVSDVGVPLGLLKQKAWGRGEERTRDKRHERAFEEKKSYKGVLGLPERSEIGETTQAIVVCDAEAHIYEFLSVLQERRWDWIVRATDARSFTETDETLFEFMAQQAIQQTDTVAVHRRPDRPARDAAVVLRSGPVTLKRPQRAKTVDETLTLWAVAVREVNPPADENGIHWVLLTSLPVTDTQTALQIVTWYRLRWLVERFHYVLKSGCKIEARQLREAKRLERLLAIYSLVAWNLLWLTYQARNTPDEPCTLALQDEEWQALYLFTQKTKKLPQKPPTLRQATHWIGQLGGFLGRQGDGDPGVKVLWRGWSCLQDIVATYKLFSPKKDVGNV